MSPTTRGILILLAVVAACALIFAFIRNANDPPQLNLPNLFPAEAPAEEEAGAPAEETAPANESEAEEGQPAAAPAEAEDPAPVAEESNSSTEETADLPEAHLPEGDLAIETHIGLNVWGGEQINLHQLSALKDEQIYFAHGDVLGNGTCAVKIFDPGEDLVLSDATWQLYLFEGSPSEIRQAIHEHQAEAAMDLNPNGDPEDLCPIINDYND